MYPTGTVVTVALVMDYGYTFTNWTIDGVEVGTSTTITYTIGNSDVILVANLAAVAPGSIPSEFDYGLRLWSEFVDDLDRKVRITIEQKDYAGTETEVIIKNVTYHIGNVDASPDTMFVTSRLEFDFQIHKAFPDLDFLLTLDPREFRVTFYRNYFSDTAFNFKWIGYLKTEFLERPEYRSTYDLSVVATDGLSDLQGYLAPVEGLDYTDAGKVIAGLINHTFNDGLPIRECIRVFEKRMTTGSVQSLLPQYTINQDALYEDEVRFQQSGTMLILNPGKSIKKAIETLLSPFVCRVFQWNGVWHIVRVMEYLKGSLRVSIYNASGTRTGFTDYVNDQSFVCIGNPERRGETGYTRFNTALKLGSVNRPESRNVLADNFSNLSWYNPNQMTPEDSNFRGRVLFKWSYINAVVFDGLRGEEFARVERVSQGENTFVRFWGTADGVTDSNLSGIRWNNRQFAGVAKDADSLTISVKFRILRRGSTDSRIPPPNSHLVAMQVKIGANYLAFDGNVTFSWTATPTLLTFPANNYDVFNSIDIQELIAPADGPIELTLCQLVTVSGTRHRYVIDWDDVNINLTRNEALTYTEVRARAVTNSPHSNEYPMRETFLGDAITNLSSSAIILKDVTGTPVSETWQRIGEPDEEEPLLGVTLSDLVNLFGKNNSTVTAVIKESETGGTSLDFRRALTYRGKPYVLTAASLDARSNIWNFQGFQISETPLDT
jgi:hypothetical protein